MCKEMFCDFCAFLWLLIVLCFLLASCRVVDVKKGSRSPRDGSGTSSTRFLQEPGSREKLKLNDQDLLLLKPLSAKGLFSFALSCRSVSAKG
jgi:hypothetical protein